MTADLEESSLSSSAKQSKSFPVLGGAGGGVGKIIAGGALDCHLQLRLAGVGSGFLGLEQRLTGMLCWTFC
jgi:hypothetical protein